MRKVLLGAGVAALLVGVMPSTAQAYSDDNAAYTDFTLSPVGGPEGTSVTVSGKGCGPTGFQGEAWQTNQVRSDVSTSTLGSHFTVQGPDGRFGTKIASTFGWWPAGNGIVDTHVVTNCPNLVQAVRPFAVNQATTTAPPRIFTSFGNGQCFFGMIFPDPFVANCPVHVKGFADDGRLSTNFYANQRAPHAGGSIAIGDVLQDGRVDVVTGSGPTEELQGGAVNVSTPDGTFLRNEIVYNGFKGGVRVAAGDVLPDVPGDEVVTAPGTSGNSLIQVFNFTTGGGWQGLKYFFAYGPKFVGGASVAVADVVGDSRQEIITGAGPGGGPHVRIFDMNGNPLGGFYAYAPNFSGGVTVSAGDLDGDGKAEIVTGTMGGGAPHVRTFRADGTPVGPGFYAYDQRFTGGVWVAVGNVDRRGGNEIVTAPGIGGMPHIRVFTSPTGAFNDPGFYAYEGLPTGVFVAVAP